MFKAQISDIKGAADIYEVEFLIEGGLKFHGIFLELKPGAAVGDGVRIGFKNTDVVLSRAPLKDVSLQNEIRAKISDLKLGEILCVAALEGELKFEAIISAKSARELGLRVGDELYAYVSCSAIYIQKYDND